MVTRNDRPHFIAVGVCACRFFSPPGRRDDKLIPGEDELGREPTARLRPRLIQQPCATLLFCLQRCFGREHIDNVPAFSGRDQGHYVAILHIHLEESGTP